MRVLLGTSIAWRWNGTHLKLARITDARAASFGLRRRRNEPWRRTVARVSYAHNLVYEVRASFDALVQRGVSESEAAISALLEWDCMARPER